MNTLEGKLLAEGQRVGIVAARFNEFITSKLLGGAIDAFVRHGGDENRVDVAWVPGAFEIPLVAKKMAKSGKYETWWRMRRRRAWQPWACRRKSLSFSGY